MKLDRRGSVALLEMNTGKANAIGPDFLSKLSAALDDFERTDARALVITGYESFFSAGLDLAQLGGKTRDEMAAFIEDFTHRTLRLFELPRPVVAAINGHAIAGGCVTALQCDERLMARGNAKIGLNEVVLAVGLPAGVVETLRAQVPPRSLVPIALEGKLSSAEEALALGLVDALVAPEELVARALARAEELGKVPTAAFAHVKSQLRKPVADRVRAALAAGDSKRWAELWTAREAQERIAAAVAKLTKKK